MTTNDGVKLILRRAKINDRSLSIEKRIALNEAAALMFTEGSEEHNSAKHNAFLLREFEHNQDKFQELIEETDPS